MILYCFVCLYAFYMLEVNYPSIDLIQYFVDVVEGVQKVPIKSRTSLWLVNFRLCMKLL